jgi:hypothetical protein
MRQKRKSTGGVYSFSTIERSAGQDPASIEPGKPDRLGSASCPYRAINDLENFRTGERPLFAQCIDESVKHMVMFTKNMLRFRFSSENQVPNARCGVAQRARQMMGLAMIGASEPATFTEVHQLCDPACDKFNDPVEIVVAV